MASQIKLRRAHPADAAAIATHRADMFAEMGLLRPLDRPMLIAATQAALQDQIEEEAYIGWVLEQRQPELSQEGTNEPAIIGGAGLYRHRNEPIPTHPFVSTGYHLANVYIHPSHRNQGHATRATLAAMEWCEANNATALTLTPAEAARALYQRLGFKDAPLMRLLPHRFNKT